MADYDDSFDYLLGGGLGLDESHLQQLADLMLAEGVDISRLSEDDLSGLLYGLEADGGTGLGPDDGEHSTAAHDHQVRFGAGTCSHCGGRGYTTWPSSGSQEACWYCSGSGIAH